jgi:enoyl-CoA hydratase
MVEFQCEGGVARIFLNRPHKVNALDSATLDALADALRNVDGTVRVVVLGGHGRAFCGGADVNELRELNPQTAREFIGRVHRACDAVRKLPMPVVARLHGAVIGAGLELAAACDLRVAAKGTRFAMPEVRLGIPSVVEAALLPRLMGSGRAAWLVLTGEAIDAARAYEWGLVEALSDAADLDQTVAGVVQSVAAGEPAALRTQKQLLQMWEEQPLATAVAASVERFVQAYTIPRAKAEKEH